MRVFLPLVLTAAAANAWQLSFYSGVDCMGELDTEVNWPTGSPSCENIPEDTVDFHSVLVSPNSADDDNYEVILWPNADCAGESVAVIYYGDGTVCFPDRSESVKSYWVFTYPSQKRSMPTRSATEVTRDVNAWVERQSTGLAVRSQETDLALGPAKTYSEVNAMLAASPDVNYFHTFISITASAVPGIASFASLVTGCIGVGSASPISQTSCALSLIATVISFMATLYHTYLGYRLIGARLQQNNIQLGFRSGARRRSIDDTMTLSHEEYMEYVLDKAGLNSTHIGYHDRISSNFTSPAYQFHGEDGQQYVLTISPTADGDVRHTVSFYHDTKIEKRQGYEGVTVNGGLDVQGCQRQAGKYNDLPTSASSAYGYYFSDAQCILSGTDWSQVNYVSSDIMDKSGNVVLTVGMSTYTGNSQNYATYKTTCDDTRFGFSSSCIY